MWRKLSTALAGVLHRRPNPSRRDHCKRQLRFEQLEPIVPLAWDALGTNIQVSTVQGTDRDQIDPVVALSPGQFDAATSTYVVVWQFERNLNYSQTELLYRQYRGDGTPVTPERSIFSGVPGNFDAQDPRIAMADNGSFVVVWEETTSAGTQQVFYTLFSPNGNPVPEFEAVAVSSNGNNSNPDVYFAPDGQYFAVTWQTRISAANRDTFFEFVDLNNLGLPTGAFAAGASTRNEFQPKITGRKSGVTDVATDRIVIAWTEGTRTETQQLDVGFNIFNISNGNPLFATQQLVTDNDNTIGVNQLNRDQYEASISADAQGNFVIVYTELFASTAFTADNDIYFRRYDSNGVAIDPGRRPVESSTLDTNEPTVSMAADGSFVVVYEEDAATGNRIEIRVAGFNTSGQRITTQNPVNSGNSSTANNALQDNPSIGLNALGNFVVVWGSNVNARPGGSTRVPGFMDIMSQRYVASPPASASASAVANITMQSVVPVTVEVTLDSAIPIDTASVQSSALEVRTASNNLLQTKFYAMSSNAAGTSVKATYQIIPPGGVWDPTDNGSYIVTLPSDQVVDIAGNSVTEQVLGTFEVDIATPDTTPPTVASFSGVQFAGDGTATFTITYQDDVAVNAAALDSNDVRVSGPNGYSQLAALVSVDDTTAGATRTATYRITAPGGSWDAADNGAYTVNVLAGQVRDTAGNAMAAQAAGTFVVNLTTPASPWHNAALRYDVNNDGRVSSLDALYIINRLNQGLMGNLSVIGAGITGFVDVNGDGHISPLDALQVINYLNQNPPQQQAATAAALPTVQDNAALLAADLAADVAVAARSTATATIAAHAIAMEQEAESLRTGKKKL